MKDFKSVLVAIFALFAISACSMTNTPSVHNAAIRPSQGSINGYTYRSYANGPIQINDRKPIYYRCGPNHSQEIIAYYFKAPNQDKFTGISISYGDDTSDMVPLTRSDHRGNLFQARDFMVETPPASFANIENVNNARIFFVRNGQRFIFDNCVIDRASTMKTLRQREAYNYIMEPPANYNQSRRAWNGRKATSNRSSYRKSSSRKAVKKSTRSSKKATTKKRVTKKATSKKRKK